MYQQTYTYTEEFEIIKKNMMSDSLGPRELYSIEGQLACPLFLVLNKARDLSAFLFIPPGRLTLN